MADPDMGNWTYTYNVLGELGKQTDAKAQTSTMIYDKLGRMTNRSEPDLISNWTYDNCTKGIGKLCSASADNGYSRTQSYDSLGRANSTSTVIDTTYVTSLTFDSNGRVATRTYPNGLVLKYVYTTLGYLSQIRNNATNVLYWSAGSMDAEGRLLQQTYGNNILTQQVFEASTGRLKNIYAGAGNSVQNLSYSYDNIGGLQSRNDGNQSLSETFLYDSLNRLTSSTVNSGGAGLVTQTYAYDNIGNMTSRSGVGTYSYGAANFRPHGVTSIALTGGGQRQYTYDANGNLTGEVQRDASNNVIAAKGRTETYTSFNMPKTIVTPTSSLTFVYDSEHQRSKQIAANVTTIYLNPDNTGGLLYEKDIKSNGIIEHRNFITAGGQVIAVAKQSGVTTTISYLHRDNMGSTSAVTDEAGSVIERLAYEPFGKRRFSYGSLDTNNTVVGVNTNRGYTNHEHLDTVGLIHMNGRVYDPVIGRFMTADPIVQAADNLQSYNRYAYVMNSPFMYTDPSGFSWWTNIRDQVVKPIAVIAASYFTMGWASAAYEGYAASTLLAGGTPFTIGGSIATTSAIAGGAAGGFAGGMVGSGGDFRSGLSGAVTGGAFGWAGGIGDADSFGRYSAHALAGCAGGEIGGGGCGRGAASAVAGKWATNATNGNFFASVVAGGTVSVMGGGSFANGARTAAFGYLYNHCSQTNCFENLMQEIRNSVMQSITEDGCIKTGGPNICLGPGAMRGVAAKGVGAAEKGGLNLFKWGEETTTKAGAWKEGDFMLHLPNQGSAQANWAQNAGRLREQMRQGTPIYDSYRNAITGERIGTDGFLRAERNLLESRGWQYNSSTGAYHPSQP